VSPIGVAPYIGYSYPEKRVKDVGEDEKDKGTCISRNTYRISITLY
jgi:hypothetical protein